MSRSETVRSSTVRTLSLFALGALCLFVSACGGGGGGGGGGNPATKSVSFLGFAFRVGSGAPFTDPPLEDLSSTPSTPGGPLNLTVLFRFSGPPSGPFNANSLPVFTTPADVDPDAGATGATPIINAKGSYVLMGNTVEFHPFIPTAPIIPVLNAPPATVPGLLPGSVYTVSISTTPATRIQNLIPDLGVVEGLVKFGTTSNPAAFYPKTGSDGSPPEVSASDPVDGSVDFFPQTFASTSLEFQGTPLFPTGPDTIQLTYDRSLEPTEDNLSGTDLDADGLLDPTFFLRAAGTRILVSQTVPADTFGVHPAFVALSGLEEGTVPDPDGADVFSHDDQSGALTDPDPELTGLIGSMATGLDASLLWSVLKTDGGNDLLSVADSVLGDPSHAAMAESPGMAPGTGPIDTGLGDLVGLVTLLDDRLVAYDRDTRRIHELLPTVIRRRPSPTEPNGQPPVMVSLSTGDGQTGFLSGAQPMSAGEIIDLAQAPSGELFALAIRSGNPAQPSLLRLAPIDFDLNGKFEAGDGLFSGLESDVVLELFDEYVDLQFVEEHRILALNRTLDTIDVIDPAIGPIGTAVADVASFGHPLGDLPDGLSPARALAVGFMDLDVDVALETNTEDGAVLRVKPVGVLPIGADISLMQRNALTSLFGTSAVNEDPEATVTPIGARCLLTLRTAEPLEGPAALIDDTFLEEFVQRQYEDDTPLSTSPLAEWAGPFAGTISKPGLRASVGVDEIAQLGDFLPSGSLLFNEDQAYKRSSATQGEKDLTLTGTVFETVLLDTDAQVFPLPGGSTPGITDVVTVFGGKFAFRDFIIPAGVNVVAKGSRPLVITATRRVEIHGVLTIKGTDGLSDDSFDSGFVPVPGGPGGPGGGRGGDSQPTLFDPAGPGSLDQYVTPETGERGYGTVVMPGGALLTQQIGGHGGLSTAGYDPTLNFIPKIPPSDNTEHHRVPGGGGGSFYHVGQPAREGSGSFRIQSNSTWFPFDKCPTNNKRSDALYGNEENFFSGQIPGTPLQCVYLTFKPGTSGDFMDPASPVRIMPGGDAGDPVFRDGDPSNDFIGEGGELPILIGGQGGGGGGSRVDSMRHVGWSRNALGSPDPAPPAPPFYPKLLIGVFLAPSSLDAKGGGGGGGGGSVQIRSFGDILIGRLGHIDASGGHGGGGEVVRSSAFSGGGGGGSGGAIILQAAGNIRIEADEGHANASFIDADGKQGASLDVSGGMGRDARTNPANTTNFPAFTFDHTRSDGGQGGAGLIQLQVGDGSGMPEIQPGAFLFAKQRSVLKLGSWTGDPNSKQSEHLDFLGPGAGNLPNELRYIDMLHYREFRAEPAQVTGDRYYVLNGSYPPIIPSADGVNGSYPSLTNEYPVGSGQTWFDTTMMEMPEYPGRLFVQEPQPEKVMKTYNGWNPVTFKEINNPASDPDFPKTPGTTRVGETIPFGILMVEPDGTLPMTEVDGKEVFDQANLLSRLPVIHPSLTPSAFGTVSTGTSRWLDFNGVAVRMRDVAGRSPPFFEPFLGTHHDSATESTPPDADSLVMVAGSVIGKPAHYVRNSPSTGASGLFPGMPGNTAPFNDIRINAPDSGLLQQDAVSDNAVVSVRFQGAYAVRSGSRIPDEETITAWVSDLTDLSGYPLVRFQVLFDIGVDVGEFPFGVESFRPEAEYLRMRATY